MAFSLPISLPSVVLLGVNSGGDTARYSARAMLSGSSSRMSTNSSAWIRWTSFAGTGAIVLATLKGGSFGLADSGRVSGLARIG